MIGVLAVAAASAAPSRPAALEARGVDAYRAGALTDAERMFAEAISARRGRRHVDARSLANALRMRSAALVALGRPDEAVVDLEEALALITEGPFTEDQVATVQRELGQALLLSGELEAAREQLEKGLDTMLRHHPGGSSEVEQLRASLGEVYRASGDLGRAVATFEQSWEAVRSRPESGPRASADAAANLGIALAEVGDYLRARTLLEEAIAIRERAAAPGAGPAMAASLDNLAGVLYLLGDVDGARARSERALALRRAAFGGPHPAIAENLDNLATLAVSQGRVEDARRLNEEALSMGRQLYGPDHPSLAGHLRNLGDALTREGDLEAAIAAYREGLALVDPGERPLVEAGLRLATANALAGVGRPEEAERELRRALAGFEATAGRDSPWALTAASLLALVRDRLGDPVEARALAERALAGTEERMELLDALSQREAIAYLGEARAVLDNWLAVHRDPTEAEAGWSRALRFKGAAAAVMTHAAAGALPAPLAAARRALAAATFAEPDPAEPAEARDARLQALGAEVERLERALVAGAGPTPEPNAEPAALCAALEPGTALVDLVRQNDADGVDHYLAFGVRGGECVVRRVDLGPSEPTDREVAGWRAALAGGAVSARADARGARVAARLWTPLAPVVGDAARVLFVPDGPVAAAPLGALPVGGGRYLLEDVAVSYLARAQDAVPRPPATGRGLVGVGGVDFDARRGEGAPSGRTGLVPCLGGGEFPALPGTAAEVDAVADLWRRARPDEPARILGGGQATEAEVLGALPGVGVAHLATHGFFASVSCRAAGDLGAIFDPMLLSGLAFAGANTRPDPLAPEDGILTALEVSTADLREVGLVVLSGCETGLGDVRSGEGVLGLRRAFSLAGARALVMSLWAVPDRETANLMEALYRELLSAEPLAPPDALRAAQRELLDRQREEGVVQPGRWAAFVAAGDWR